MIVVCACRGGQLGSDGGVSQDGASSGDAVFGSCDTASQAGCAAGLKCTWVEALGRPGCVPDGTQPIGAACEDQPAGYDNCVKGGLCSGGTCAQLCASSPDDTCDATMVCNTEANPHPLPICVSTCNPDTQLSADYTDCPAGQGCYLDPFVGKPICDAVPAMAATRKQGAVCYSPYGPLVCAMNGCSAGYASFFLDPDNSFLCGAFCAPANSYIGAQTALLGIAPDDCSASRIGVSGTECRFIQHWYPDTPTPSAYGICIATASWGSCATFDPQGMVDAYNTAYTNATGDADAKAAAGNAAFCSYCGLDASCHGTLAARCTDNGCIDKATEASFGAMYLGQSGPEMARRIQALATPRARAR